MLSHVRHMIYRYLIEKQGFTLGMGDTQLRCRVGGLNIGLASPYTVNSHPVNS